MEHKKEFNIEPEIIVLWAVPEVGRLWYFQELLQKGIIHKLIYRADNGDGIGCTSFFAALNIWEGLTYIKNNYQASQHYIIYQDCDIWPNPNTYRLIDQEMQKDDANAVLFFWANHIAHSDVWHTNLFAVSFDEKYWPPQCERNSHDVLERVCGKRLAELHLPGIFISHNSRELKFAHCHLDNKLGTFDLKSQNHHVSLGLYLLGYYTFRQKMYNFYRSCLKWLKLS